MLLWFYVVLGVVFVEQQAEVIKIVERKSVFSWKKFVLLGAPENNCKTRVFHPQSEQGDNVKLSDLIVEETLLLIVPCGLLVRSHSLDSA